MSEDKTTFEKQVEARLAELKAEADRLQARMQKAAADGEAEYRRYWDEIRKAQADLEARYDALREAGTDGWSDMKRGVEDASRRMQEAMKQAFSRFG